MYVYLPGRDEGGAVDGHVSDRDDVRGTDRRRHQGLDGGGRPRRGVGDRRQESPRLLHRVSHVVS